MKRHPDSYPVKQTSRLHLGLFPGICTIEPRLPSDWKELSITRIHLRDHVIDIRVTGKTIEVTDHNPASPPLVIEHPPEWKLKFIGRVLDAFSRRRDSASSPSSGGSRPACPCYRTRTSKGRPSSRRTG